MIVVTTPTGTIGSQLDPLLLSAAIQGAIEEAGCDVRAFGYCRFLESLPPQFESGRRKTVGGTLVD